MDMTTISSYNHQHETFWINTNLNQKKTSRKVPQNSAKNNITTTSWKTCKPRQHHLGIQILISSENKYEIGTTKKEHQQKQNGEFRAVMSAGSGKGNANPHNHRETPTEDRTGDDTFGHGGNYFLSFSTQM